MVTLLVKMGHHAIFNMDSFANNKVVPLFSLKNRPEQYFSQDKRIKGVKSLFLLSPGEGGIKHS